MDATDVSYICMMKQCQVQVKDRCGVGATGISYMHNKEVLTVAQVKHRCGVDATGVLYDETVLCVSAQKQVWCVYYRCIVYIMKQY